MADSGHSCVKVFISEGSLIRRLPKDDTVRVMRGPQGVAVDSNVCVCLSVCVSVCYAYSGSACTLASH